MIDPDIPKEELDETWKSFKKRWNLAVEIQNLSQKIEKFYLKSTIFKLSTNNSEEYITIGFSAQQQKENLEKKRISKKSY